MEKLTRQSPNLTRYPFGTPANGFTFDCCPVGGGAAAIAWHFSLIAMARLGCMRSNAFKASRVQVSLGMAQCGTFRTERQEFRSVFPNTTDRACPDSRGSGPDGAASRPTDHFKTARH